MSNTLEINTDLINWAISRAGYEQGEFYDQFPRAKGWLEKDKKPTLPQLRDFARKVHLPFGYLLLDQPPEEKLPIPFFRTTGSETDRIHVNLRDTILTIQKRQDWIRDYLIEQDADPLEFIGKFDTDTPLDEITNDIRNALGLSDEWADEHASWQKALNHLTGKVDQAGIYILFNSVVDNNTHRPIPVDECRGFVLSDQYAPFMFVNAADSKSAQMFTIIHELAHLWIGESAGFDFRQLQPARNAIEMYCDAVAAEFLVPKNQFEQHWHISRDFEDLAKTFKVSQIVVARRALDLDKITRDDFFEFYNEHIAKFKQRKESQGDGGNFYATLRRRLNPRFLSAVNRAVKEQKLLYKHAYELTGLKGSTYQEAIKRYDL